MRKFQKFWNGLMRNMIPVAIVRGLFMRLQCGVCVYVCEVCLPRDQIMVIVGQKPPIICDPMGYLMSLKCLLLSKYAREYTELT